MKTAEQKLCGFIVGRNRLKAEAFCDNMFE